MLRTKLLGAATLAALAFAMPAHAGGGSTGGDPVELPGDDPGDQPGGGGDELPGGGDPSTPTPPPASGYTGLGKYIEE